MEISLLLMQQIAQLFLILIMGYAVVKVGLLKASDSRVLSVVMVYALPFTATNTLSRATGHLMCRAPWCLAAAI